MTIYKIQGKSACFEGFRINRTSEDPFQSVARGATGKFSRYRNGNICIDCDGGSLLEMKKETIIYFEQLGFGWVLDQMILKEIQFTKLRDECITDTSLIKIIENMLIENPSF